MRAPFQILAIPYRMDDGILKYCAFHRSDCDEWQFIAGGGEDAETPLEAAQREAFEECGIDPTFYANRRRSFDEILPWDHLDYGISKKFLVNENKKAHESLTTPHCRIQCAGCGSNKLNGGKCDALSKA